MRTTKSNKKHDPDPYEDYVRSEKLDPYEALIESNRLLRKNNKCNKLKSSFN